MSGNIDARLVAMWDDWHAECTGGEAHTIHRHHPAGESTGVDHGGQFPGYDHPAECTGLRMDAPRPPGTSIPCGPIRAGRG